ncbi:hypothetical protein Adt_12892 [Abeliophyllum distichum]|uniref:DUF538 domain-containing protein n=1 Tax=Abeliophyllum distichum TaxID=126358 RepID=A0ABD1TVA1_9LAMI
MELVKELGFPSGVLPLKDIVECGRVLWMKQTTPYEHLFVGGTTPVRYGIEVTAYVEKGRMNGVKSKQLLVWVPIVEMSIEQSDANKIHFNIPIGIGKSFPLTDFMTPDEKKMYLEFLKDP